jgi:hypothetical protein
VKQTEEAVSIAAQTLGTRTMSPDELKALVEDKFVDSLRATAATMTIQELQDKRRDGDPGTAGDREDPHALESAGARTASCAGPWPSDASSLTLPNPNPNRSGDPVTSRWSRLRPRVRGTDGSGFAPRDNPQ